MAVPSRLLEAHLDIPSVVEIPPRKKSVEVAVRAGVRNVSEHDYVLHAAGDETVFWHVLELNQREVLRAVRSRKKAARGKYQEHPFQGLTVAAGHTAHQTETLTLDATRLEDGKTYTVRAQVWGQPAEASFVAVQGKAAPPRKKKKAAPSEKKKAAPSEKKKAAPPKKKKKSPAKGKPKKAGKASEKK